MVSQSRTKTKTKVCILTKRPLVYSPAAESRRYTSDRKLIQQSTTVMVIAVKFLTFAGLVFVSLTHHIVQYILLEEWGARAFRPFCLGVEVVHCILFALNPISNVH